ncbi:AGAP001631-PA-like protein [Anopheles sinensis]|uniref:AGAP001631-PA-like protein n=1 Tax=Anopheles sinensis TaxID=74873 RepID=A0A084W5F5_ANOSI|nr:AGAP001631-PA-like protein [Anopheles sinensis]
MIKPNLQRPRKISTVSSVTISTPNGEEFHSKPAPQRRRRYSFKRELFHLFNTTTAHCYRQLAQPDRTVWERLVWLLVLILEAATLVAIIISAWGNFTENPLITTLYDTVYPIELVPFPAISLCNNNRISRSAAHQYAQQLARRDPDRHNVSYFLEQILLLGKLYDFDFENVHQMTRFQEFLDLNDVTNATGMYSALDTLERVRNGRARGIRGTGTDWRWGFPFSQLSPRCEDMLLRCFWKSIELPCMTKNDMIEVRRTQYGFCCTFNFIGHNEDNEIHQPSYFLDITGPEMGLVLLLNGSSNDYFYNLFNNIGFNLQIFNPTEVPDMTSGGISEQFIHLGTETFIRVDAITINSEPDVLRYSREKVSTPVPECDAVRVGWEGSHFGHTAMHFSVHRNIGGKRQCVFRNELLKYGGSYGRSNCVAACRIRSVLALCECVPFYMQTAGSVAGGRSLTTCNLQHIACLNKYKIKWSTVITDIVRIPGLEKEMEESLYCPECLPPCSDSQYQITASELPLIRTHRDGFSVTAGIEQVADVSVVRIFFGQPETWMYKQDVAYYWFEILSNFGGMFGIMAGMSLITLTEAVYFVARQLLLLVYTSRTWSARRRQRKPTTLQLLE